MAHLKKYKQWHNQIIKRARKRKLKKPYDRHHVVPRSLGGTNDKSNIVRLTHREHFLIHWLLVKIHRGENKKKMWFAMSLMRFMRGRHLTSWQYAKAREAGRQALLGNQHLKGYAPTAETRVKLATNKGKKFSRSHRKKISLALIGNRSFSGKRHSEETKKKIADWHRGRTLSKATRRKISLARMGQPSPRKGVKITEQTRERMRLGQQKRWSKT